MLSIGQTAPDFSLPGVRDGIAMIFDLFRAVDAGTSVVLLFYPTAYESAALCELQGLRDAGWDEEDSTVDVWVVTGDSTYANAAFADRYDVPFVMLSDFHAGVADAYDVRIDDWEAHGPAPGRAIGFISPNWTIEHGWSTDDVFATPRRTPVASLAEAVVATTGEPRFGPSRIDVSYESGR